MKKILLMGMILTLSSGLSYAEFLMTVVKPPGSLDVTITREKLILYPNPATTELNIEFGDRSFSGAIFTINDMSGRRYVVIPVKDKERLTIPLDRRFSPGDYTVTLMSGSNKISKSFSVVE